MKRTILFVPLLAMTTLSASADTSIYTNVLKQPRGDDALQGDGEYCDQRFGAVQNGATTSARYKKCMLSRGWHYGYTKREHTYPDPDNPGLTSQFFRIAQFGQTVDVKIGVSVALGHGFPPSDSASQEQSYPTSQLMPARASDTCTAMSE